MIEWTTIASTAVGILIAFVTKVGDKVADKTGEAIFELFKSKFKGDKEAQDILKKFNKKPERYHSALADIVKEKAENDRKFGDSLQMLVLQVSESSIPSNTQMAKGKNIAQAIGQNSKASVTIKGRQK